MEDPLILMKDPQHWGLCVFEDQWKRKSFDLKIHNTQNRGMKMVKTIPPDQTKTQEWWSTWEYSAHSLRHDGDLSKRSAYFSVFTLKEKSCQSLRIGGDMFQTEVCVGSLSKGVWKWAWTRKIRRQGDRSLLSAIRKSKSKPLPPHRRANRNGWKLVGKS